MITLLTFMAENIRHVDLNIVIHCALVMASALIAWMLINHGLRAAVNSLIILVGVGALATLFVATVKAKQKFEVAQKMAVSLAVKGR